LESIPGTKDPLGSNTNLKKIRKQKRNLPVFPPNTPLYNISPTDTKSNIKAQLSYILQPNRISTPSKLDLLMRSLKRDVDAIGAAVPNLECSVFTSTCTMGILGWMEDSERDVGMNFHGLHTQLLLR